MKKVAMLIGAALLAAGFVAQASGATSSNKDVVRFDSLAPVSGPFVGATNPIRDISGGGFPWQIDQARGQVGSDGTVRVEVEGLVLLDGDPVPTDLQGTNPVPAFKAVVSCLSSVDGVATTSNVSTDTFPASAAGDAKIVANVALPSPCVAPIVFVTTPTGAWLAVTGS